jgi:hypothetical protein
LVRGAIAMSAEHTHVTRKYTGMLAALVSSRP